MEIGQGRRADIEALIVGFVVIAGLVLAVALTSYTPHELGYGLGMLLAVVLYVSESRRARSNGSKMPTIVWVNLGLIVLLLVVNYLYGVSNQPIGDVHSVETSIDTHVPVVPPFVVPYLAFYAYIVFSIAYIATHLLHEQLRTLLLALILATAVGLITFVIFQTYAPPPTEFGSEPFRSMMLYVENDLYAGNFYSAFPSLHVAFSVVLAIAWWRLRRPVLSPLLVLLSVAIVLSTQFLHQHFVMDLLYGVVLAVAAYATAWWAWGR